MNFHLRGAQLEIQHLTEPLAAFPGFCVSATKPLSVAQLLSGLRTHPGAGQGESPSRSPLKKRNLGPSSVCALRVFRRPAQDTLAQESIPHSGPHVTASPRGAVGVGTLRSSRLGLLPTRNEDNNPYPTRVLQFQLLSVKGFVVPGLKAMLDERTEAVTKVTVVIVS